MLAARLMAHKLPQGLTIHIWDSQAGQVVAGPLGGHPDDVCFVAFSPGGTRVASGPEDMRTGGRWPLKGLASARPHSRLSTHELPLGGHSTRQFVFRFADRVGSCKSPFDGHQTSALMSSEPGRDPRSVW